MKRLASIGVAAVLACVAPAREARAEPEYWVRLRTEPRNLRIRLTAVKGRRVLPLCSGECVLALRAGEHQLRLYDAEGRRIGARRVRVEHAATWVVSPESSSERSAGVVVLIAGGVLFAAGTFFAVPLVTESGCHDTGGCLSDAERTAGYGGLLAMVAGAVAMPIGGTLLERRGPNVEVRPFDGAASAQRRPSVRVGFTLSF